VIDGKEVTFGLNGKYVSDFIRATENKDLVISIASPEKPLVFTDLSDSAYKYIVRPLMK
jgi:DNA polymerase III sliding clamp (beta) subunit (PCNA family)